MGLLASNNQHTNGRTYVPLVALLQLKVANLACKTIRFGHTNKSLTNNPQVTHTLIQIHINTITLTITCLNLNIQMSHHQTWMTKFNMLFFWKTIAINRNLQIDRLVVAKSRFTLTLQDFNGPPFYSYSWPKIQVFFLLLKLPRAAWTQP